MTFSVNVVEFIWITVNTVTLFLTITAYFDARADRTAVRLLNGRARELAATGIVRREGLRMAVQILLLGVALPGLFTDREATFNPVIVALMAVPVLLLIASFLDSRDRKDLTVLVTAEALNVKTTALDRIERKVEESIVVAHEAAEASNTRPRSRASDHDSAG